MHYSVCEDLHIYLASIKGDPKTIQITNTPTVSLLVYSPGDTINESNEVEISGRAVKVKEESERARAFTKLRPVSPVVDHLVEAGNTEILEVIKVAPILIKYRVFKEIVQGIPPTVLDFQDRRFDSSHRDLALLLRKLKIWWMELRPSFLIATLIPLLLGGFVAWNKTGMFSWLYLLLTLLGGLLLHMGTNIINDYFDHKSRNDELNREFVRPFSGGSRLIQLGLLTPVEVLGAGLLCFVLGSTVGIYLAWTRGPLILVLGLIGVVSGFFYTAPPFKLANRGIGELIIGINFGMLMTLGSYFVQTQNLDLEPLLVSLPVTFLIAAVVYINEFPDYEADRKVGKKTLVVRLGRKRAASVYMLIIIAAYLSIIIGALSGAISVYSALALLSIPLAVKGIRFALAHYDRPFDLVPANISTIMVHLITGVLLMAAYILDRSGLRGLWGVVPLSAIAGLIILWLHHHIEGQNKAFTDLKSSL